MVCDYFCISLDEVANNCLRVFVCIVIKSYWPETFFFVVSVSLWYKDSVSLVE